MAQQALSLFIMYLLFSSTFAKAEEDEEGSCGIMDALPYMVIGAGTNFIPSCGCRGDKDGCEVHSESKPQEHVHKQNQT
uniref:Uncharacterized protein n=1 Tax=Callorhinchus milii TaxID=7868 RepID=A0A4W3GL30_CALMI